jgi:hypothetical protein
MMHQRFHLWPAARLSAVFGAMLFTACNRDATTPPESGPPVVADEASSRLGVLNGTDVPPISAAKLTARTRTLNGCRYTYYGDLQVAAPSAGGAHSRSRWQALRRAVATA